MARFLRGIAGHLVQWADELAFSALGLVATQLDKLFHFRNAVAHRLFLGRAGPVSGPIVRFIRAYYGAKIRALAVEFEPEFYVSQIPDAFGRASATGDPILHYLMFGHLVGLSPNRTFEPRYYREQHAHLSLFTPPFLDFLKRGRPSGEAPNHLAARSPTESARGLRGTAAMVIDHPRGGGSTRYLNIYEAKLRAEGFKVIRGRRVSGGLPLIVFGEEPDAPWFNPFEDQERLDRFVREAGVGHMVINHMVDVPGAPLDWARTACERLGLSYEVILHDYFMVCPRITLVDAQGRYCGVGDAAACGACLGASREFDGIDITAWRASAGSLLMGATRVVAPSEDLAMRIRQTFPAVEIEVFEPELTVTMPQRAQRPLRVGERLRVTMLGALDEPKGYAVIAELAKWIRATGAPIQLQVIGDTKGTRQLQRLGVTVTGRYTQADLDILLDRLSPHLFFFPAIWPETWSFTLTTALARGIPIAAFDIGAIAQRLRRAGAGALLPYELHDKPGDLGAWLLQFRLQLSRSETPQMAAGPAAMAEISPT